MEPIIKIVQAMFNAFNSSTYGLTDHRAAFLKDFFRAWCKVEPGRDIPVIGSGRSESYHASMLTGSKPFPKTRYPEMLSYANRESFTTWLRTFVPEEWERAKANLREIGAEVNTPDELYDLIVCTVRESMQSQKTKKSKKQDASTETAKAAQTADESVETETPAVEAVPETEKQVTAEPPADGQQVSVPSRLYFRLQRGFKALMTFDADEGDAALAAFTSADQAGKGAILYIGVEDSAQEIILARYPDGAIHLALPLAVPASMLCEPEAYRIVATICNLMQPVVQRGDNNANRFFMKKVAKLQVALANGAQPDDKPLPYDDEKSEISFVVKRKPWVRGEEFTDFSAAREAWQKASPLAMLEVRFANPALGQEWRATIASRAHLHYDDIYRIPLMMASDKVKAFLSEYSTGKMTFWGLT